MPGGGGPATRLTWLGANTIVRGWTPDGRILFVSDVGQAVQLTAPRLRHRHPRRAARATAVRSRPRGGVRARTAAGGARPQHRRSGPMEAVPGRHRRRAVGRPAGERPVQAPAAAEGEPGVADVDRQAGVVPVRPRGHRQPLLVPARRAPTCSATPTTTSTTPASPRPTAPPSSTSTRPRSGSTTPRRDEAASSTSSSAAPGCSATASSWPPTGSWAASPSTRRATPSPSRRGGSCSPCRCGRRPCTSTAGPTACGTGWRPVVGDGSTMVVVSDEGGEDGLEVNKPGQATRRLAARPRLHHRSRHRRPTGARWRWPTTATSCTSSTSTPAPPGSSTAPSTAPSTGCVVGRRGVAGLQLRHHRPHAVDQAVRGRHRRHTPVTQPRVPRRPPVVGPGRQVPLLPLLPGVRPRLRLAVLRPRLPRAIRPYLVTLTRRRAVAVRAEAQGVRRRRSGRRGRQDAAKKDDKKAKDEEGAGARAAAHRPGRHRRADRAGARPRGALLPGRRHQGQDPARVAARQGQPRPRLLLRRARADGDAGGLRPGRAAPRRPGRGDLRLRGLPRHSDAGLPAGTAPAGHQGGREAG